MIFLNRFLRRSCLLQSLSRRACGDNKFSAPGTTPRYDIFGNLKNEVAAISRPVTGGYGSILKPTSCDPSIFGAIWITRRHRRPKRRNFKVSRSILPDFDFGVMTCPKIQEEPTLRPTHRNSNVTPDFDFDDIACPKIEEEPTQRKLEQLRFVIGDKAYVSWDWNNVLVSDAALGDMIQKLKKMAKNDVTVLVVFHRMTDIARATFKEHSCYIIYVADGKNIADIWMQLSTVQWAEHVQKAGTLVLVSGDGIFCSTVDNLPRRHSLVVLGLKFRTSENLQVKARGRGKLIII